MKWLKKLLGLCDHRWVIIQTITMYSEIPRTLYEAERAIPIGTKYVLQCEHCGNIKSKKNY